MNTMEEILQYNKRCAEFLGISNGYFKSEIDCPTPEYEWMCARANCTYQIQKEDFPLLNVWDYLEFHSDWNWIMAVVEAIEKLGYESLIGGGEYYYPEKGMRYIQSFIKDEINIHEEAKTKKEAVVQAINQFLIWYEQNKTT